MDGVGWYEDNSGYETQPAGQKKANGLGLYDMIGNVLEWGSDTWSDSVYSTRTDCDSSCTVDPHHTRTDNPYRVYRGGFWCSDARYCRSSYRDGSDPSSCDGDLGFRILRTKSKNP